MSQAFLDSIEPFSKKIACLPHNLDFLQRPVSITLASIGISTQEEDEDFQLRSSLILEIVCIPNFIHKLSAQISTVSDYQGFTLDF